MDLPSWNHDVDIRPGSVGTPIENVEMKIVDEQGRQVPAGAAEALQTLCRGAIASYKVPETIEFVSALPKNPTGKILKKELRQRAALE